MFQFRFQPGKAVRRLSISWSLHPLVVVWVCAATGGMTGLQAQSGIQQPGPGQASGRIPLVQFEPDSAAGMVEVARIAESLKRSTDAKQYLRTLLSSQPTESELQDLRTRFGIGVFLQLNSNPDLQPEARELLMAVNAASRSFAASEARLQELAQQLGSSDKIASDAIVEILAAEDRAAAPLLALDVQTAQGRMAQQILERHARIMRHGLLAAMETADSAGQLRIVRLLAPTADPHIGLSLLRWQFGSNVSAEVREATAVAVARLLSHQGRRTEGVVVPTSPEDAVRRLCAAVRQELSLLKPRFPESSVDGVARPTPTPDEQSRRIAQATNWANAAVEILPSDLTAQALLIVCRSAALPPSTVVSEPLPADVPMDVLLLSLDEALELQIPQAALQILQTVSVVLTDTSDADTLHSSHLMSAVRSAQQSPEVQVRLLASQVQLKHGLTALNDTVALRTLAAVREGNLIPEAVVIDTDAKRLPGLTSVLGDSGYVAVAARTGADGFDAAAGQMQCELVLINCYCIRWDLTMTIANLRADARTRNCPIVVYGPERERHYVRSIAQRYPGVWFIVEPFGNLTVSEAAVLQQELQGLDSNQVVSNQLTVLGRLRNAGVPEPRLEPDMRRVLQQSAFEF